MNIFAGDRQLRLTSEQFQELEKLKNVPSEATFNGKQVVFKFDCN